ncbi:MAG: 30S ribosomal protein S16 [Chloroflexi bacterium]|nr:30S ribosomal protein S16 [Chloroflexota bacterium]
MVRIRLRRVGAKGHPFYRIVVADQKAPRNGKFIDQVGTYDPFPDPPEIIVDEEKTLKWLRNGASPSESVTQLLKKSGLLEKVK